MNSEQRHRSCRPLRGAALLLMFAFLLCGCGRSTRDALPRASVAGSVTLDGTPLAAGVIRFVPADGTTGPQTTAVIKDGLFSLPTDLGPIVGNHCVEIESTDTGGLAMDDETGLQQLLARTRSSRIPVTVVPPIYNQRSQLKAVVPEAGAADLRFDLGTVMRR